MARVDGTHTCHFMLEQNAKGYFTGNFICTYCGLTVAQSQLFDSLTVTSSGRELSHGLSRTAPHPCRS
ncbi:MAG TPA: hypothetical protein VJR03_06500 [Nitrospira sp.]|nr:hypothetical protein [Nitrospira sp.]